MRRRYLAAVAGATLAAGFAFSGSALGQQPATYEQAEAQMDRSLDAFRNAVVSDPFDERPARQRALRRQVARFHRGLTTAEESEGAPISAATLDYLHEAEEHMRDYLDAVLGGDRPRMQIVSWRFLWVQNVLPTNLRR